MQMQTMQPMEGLIQEHISHFPCEVSGSAPTILSELQGELLSDEILSISIIKITLYY
jgi:hypothetical protein